MAKRGGKRWHGASGVLVAYLIVLQAVLSGLALGAMPVRADPLSVICDTKGDELAPASGKHKGGMPGCCVAGCQMFGGGMAPPPGAEQSVHAPAELRAGAEFDEPGRISLPAERGFRSARAPPARS